MSLPPKLIAIKKFSELATFPGLFIASFGKDIFASV